MRTFLLALLCISLAALVSTAGAVKIMGNFLEDDKARFYLVVQGHQIVPFGITQIDRDNPDVILVGNEGDIDPSLLKSHLNRGRVAVVSNRVNTLWLESFGIQKDLGALVGYNDGSLWRQTVPGPVSGKSYSIQVYQDTNPAGSLHSLKLTRGSWDYAQRYQTSEHVVVGGIRVGQGYLLVVPHAVFGKTDAFYFRSDLKSTEAYFEEAIRLAASRVQKATPTPEAAPAVQTPAPTPEPETPAPPTPTPTPAAPAPRATPRPTPAPPPSRLSGVLLGVVAVVLLVVVVAAVALRRRRRPPYPYGGGGGVGMGYEPPPTLGDMPPPPPPPGY
ncbi:MAG: hypothetical protein HY558_00355 [Euryarchaeota archaeon]|nr:hypothetical protein [Euryarchaeota archaeon]